MALQILVAHTGERIQADPGSFASYVGPLLLIYRADFSQARCIQDLGGEEHDDFRT